MSCQMSNILSETSKRNFKYFAINERDVIYTESLSTRVRLLSQIPGLLHPNQPQPTVPDLTRVDLRPVRLWPALVTSGVSSSSESVMKVE